jgi:hypothetical protein
MFVAFRSASVERGNGLNRSPSPTEKHKLAMTPIRTIVRTKQDLILHSLLVIYSGNNTRMVVCHDTQDCTVCDRATEIAETFSYWEAYTYLGSDSSDRIALANEIAGRPPARFAAWARENFPV